MMLNNDIIIQSGCASSPDSLEQHGDDLKSCGKCLFCKEHLNCSTVFQSSITGEKYRLANGGSDIDIACRTKNVVYLITCELCQFQYVGMTTQAIRTRFYSHRSAINNHKINTILYYHFLSGHKAHNCKVQIIYHYNKNDNEAKNVLLNVEEFYMRKLCTLYPFGLNDNITSMNMNLSSFDYSMLNCHNTPFFTFGSKRKKRSHGHRRRPKTKNTTLDIRKTIDQIFEIYGDKHLHNLYTLLRSINRHTIEKCLVEINVYCNKDRYKQSILEKILFSYRSQYIKPLKDKEEDCIYFNIPFLHSAIEKVGVEGLLGSKNIKAHLPNIARNVNVRTTYSYGPTIGRKIFNYNKTLNNLEKKDLFEDVCDCRDNYSAFVYEPHGHVHTGNLGIIKNVKLKDVMSKGAKFRLTPSISKSKILATLKTSIEKLRKKLSRKCKLKEINFEMWFDILWKSIKNRCRTLTPDILYSNDIFEDDTVNAYLSHLHERFVIVPVDKASNNFSIICKRFYFQVLKTELGIGNDKFIIGNKVYQHIDKTTGQFFKEQTKANLDIGNILEEEDKYIPILYWTSKQHKNPYKFRFIAGASRSTNKAVNVEVSLALKCIKKQFKNYCAVIKRNSGLNYFWSVDNSQEFLDKLNDVKKADTVETFDFSTLYTNLPLDKIYISLEQLIIKMFKNSGSLCILVNATRKKAFWCNGKDYIGYKRYTIDKLLDALKFILYNSYIQFANMIFKQITGVPMGSNSSPFIADLYLAWHEYCFMAKLSKYNYKLALTLSKNSRYIDDIAVINYLGFSVLSGQIYDSSLTLEGSTTGYHYDTFLDLQIRIFQNRFIIGIYHKVDDFNFEVINFPFPQSNISYKIGFTTFYSQLIRFFRLCNNLTDFIARVNLTYHKLLVRGYSDRLLSKYFFKFASSYPVGIKYGVLDFKTLWAKCLENTSVRSCNVSDADEVRQHTKSCYVELIDYFRNPTNPSRLATGDQLEITPTMSTNY